MVKLTVHIIIYIIIYKKYIIYILTNYYMKQNKRFYHLYKNNLLKLLKGQY